MVFGKFWVIFVQKYLFLPLLKNNNNNNNKKNWVKNTFWLFLKNTVFNQKSDEF